MKYIRLPELISHVALKKPTIYKLIKKGLFPKPIKLGRSSLWSAEEVNSFLINKMRERGQ
jgi:prophage regulatory protein